MIAQMAERLITNSEVPSSSPGSGSNETIFSKLKSYCLFQHIVIRNIGETGDINDTINQSINHSGTLVGHLAKELGVQILAEEGGIKIFSLFLLG